MVVYIIRNKVNDKKYVGQTRLENPNRRWKVHVYELKKNFHHNEHLQNAWNKYGEKNFEFIIVDDTAKTLENLLLLEEYYIEKYKTLDENFGYNMTSHGNPDYIKESTRNKIRKNSIAMWETEEIRNKIITGMKKSYENPIHKNKQAKILRSNALSSEEQSKVAKNLWKNPEYRKRGLEQLREAKLLDNISERLTDYWKNPEYRNKMILQNSKTYDGVVSPDGRIYSPIVNLHAFAKEHGLDSSSLIKVMKGKYNHHKGWIKYIPEEANV